MNILMVIDQYDEGNNGTTISAQRFVKGLRERGHQVRVAAAGSSAPDKYLQPAIRFPALADNIIRSQGMVLAKADHSSLEAAVDWADVVHFMMPFALSRTGLKIAEAKGKPHTAAFHVQPENITSTLKLGKIRKINDAIYSEFRDNFYNRFTHIHCPSRFIAGQLAHHGYSAKLHVISNGVDSCFYPRQQEKKPYLAGKLAVLMIGRFSEEKRQDVLIEAAGLSRYREQIQLLLAGQGPRRAALEQLGKALPNPPIMNFYTTEQLCEIMAMSDLYVYAADVEIEAIACLEAISSGLVPVIADSPLSATPQFALDERSLFRAGDAGDLARKMDYWFDNPLQRREMGEKYAASTAQYRLGDSILKAEEMFHEAIAERA